MSYGGLNVNVLYTWYLVTVYILIVKFEMLAAYTLFSFLYTWHKILGEDIKCWEEEEEEGQHFIILLRLLGRKFRRRDNLRDPGI